MIGLFINTVPLRVRLDARATVGGQCAVLQRQFAMLRDTAISVSTSFGTIAGIGEMFDTLLVYVNFPPGEVVGHRGVRHQTG